MRQFSVRRCVLALVALLTGGFTPNVEGQPSRQPAGPAHSFASGSSAKGIKFELINHLVLVQARVNNSDPLWFIFDTGASNTVIDTKRANTLGLKAQEEIRRIFQYDGGEHNLTLKRDGQMIKVKLKLRRLI